MKSTVFVHRRFPRSVVHKNIFGGFLEHLGRAIYTGIYEPGHPAAAAEGFRSDVAALVRELDMPLTRYPGGNYVSSFDWRDSIGPVEKRPVRADYNWYALETNRFGLHEFVKWCKVVGTEPLYTVNLGTGTPKEAMECVEYCNVRSGTALSDLRRRNGAEEPFGIRYWCLGNEMDGKWQIGEKTGQEYGRVAREAAKLMKLVDPSIKVVLCGSSNYSIASFGAFDLAALREAYERVDFLALHCYYSNRDRDYLDFFASPERMDRQIEAAACFCDTVREELKSPKTLQLSFDEWNVWYRSRRHRPEPGTPWRSAPSTLEEPYDMADVPVVGGCLMSLMEHADRVGIACLAQTVNVIAPIMTVPGGGVWKQTIFYPFYYMSKYGRGTLLRQTAEGDRYEARGMSVPFLRSVVIHREAEKELVVFVINRDLADMGELAVEFGGFKLAGVREAVKICHDSLEAVNTPECEKVRPEPLDAAELNVGADTLRVRLAPASWNMIRLALAE